MGLLYCHTHTQKLCTVSTYQPTHVALHTQKLPTQQCRTRHTRLLPLPPPPPHTHRHACTQSGMDKVQKDQHSPDILWLLLLLACVPLNAHNFNTHSISVIHADTHTHTHSTSHTVHILARRLQRVRREALYVTRTRMHTTLSRPHKAHIHRCTKTRMKP